MRSTALPQIGVIVYDDSDFIFHKIIHSSNFLKKSILFIMESQKKHKTVSTKKARTEIKKKMLGYIVAGLGLVASLAWNDAISNTIKYFIPESGNTVIAKLFYALLVTSIVGLILYYVEKSLQEDAGK